MKLIKKRDLTGQEAKHALSGVLGSAIDRRTFLSRTGLALGGGAVAGALPTSMIGRAEVAKWTPDVVEDVTDRKSVV